MVSELRSQFNHIVFDVLGIKNPWLKNWYPLEHFPGVVTAWDPHEESWAVQRWEMGDHQIPGIFVVYREPSRFWGLITFGDMGMGQYL